MGYWRRIDGTASELRLYAPGQGWRAYLDVTEVDGTTSQAGCRLQVESLLLNALNATNLVLLTGAGASFAARNGGATEGRRRKTAVTDDTNQPPSMGDLWDAVAAAVGEPDFSHVLEVLRQTTGAKNIERLLTLCKLHLELHEGQESTSLKKVHDFVAQAERAILARVDCIDRATALDAHSAVIQKIGRRGVRKPRAKIFTTNYDLCFEEAARRYRFTVIDGFSHTLDQVYDGSYFGLDVVRRTEAAPDYLESVFHLYKLHGSVDWRRAGGEIVRSRDPDGEPVLIYPRSSKYQEAFDAPYLDMMGALQAAIREPDTAIVVCGFGFNDDHISRPLLAALEANMSLRMVICDPAWINESKLLIGDHLIAETDKPSNRFLSAFLRLADTGDPRIHLLSGRFQDLAAALPDLVGETDRDRHNQRVKALRDSAK